MKKFLYVFSAIIILSCSNDANKQAQDYENKETLVEGNWLLEFKLSDNNIVPINFMLTKKDTTYEIVFSNAAEKLLIKNVSIDGDKITILDPVVNSWFEGKIDHSTSFKGQWYKDGKEYKIPFTATHNESSIRFAKPANTAETTGNLSGKWEVDFSKNNPEDHYKAIGQFKHVDNHLTGTFITETGDYRFLEGNVYNDSLYLSCYDGSHLFLFKALLRNDSLIGNFWSGTHWEEPWVAVRNSSFELTHPDSLTYLKEGYSELAFTFPDLNGNEVSLSDEKYMNKVVIVNIMGPWCPNCRDEMAYLSDLYAKKHQDGLEIIALAFNKSEDFEVAKENILKVKNFYHAEYDFLIAGKANKIAAAKSLPMLNHIMSYPTSIFIDRNGKIRKIRTGFYGPGTGEYYQRYTARVDSLITELLQEKPKN